MPRQDEFVSQQTGLLPFLDGFNGISGYVLLAVDSKKIWFDGG